MKTPQSGRLAGTKNRLHLLAPYAVFVGSAVLAAAVAYFAWRTSVGDRKMRSQDLALASVKQVQDRVSVNLAALQAARALLQGDRLVPQKSFEDFVAFLQPTENYPGIRGLGVSVRVRKGEEEAVIAPLRSNFADAMIWPLSDNPDLYPTVLVAPLNSITRRRIGYDPFASELRRSAMEQARDSDRPVATDPVALEATQGVDPAQMNFVVYAPLYTGTATPTTVEDRRTALSGFVSTAISPPDLFGGIAPDQTAFQVFDRDRQLYVSPDWDRVSGSSLQSTHMVQAFGRTWTMQFVVAPGLVQGAGELLPLAFAIAGTILSAALFFITRAQVAARSKAEAQEGELRLFKAAVDHAAEAVVIMADRSGERIIEYVNPAYCKMTGYSREEILGRAPGFIKGPRTEAGEIDRLNQTLKRGEIFHGEATFYRKDGAEFLRQWHVAPIVNELGRVAHYVSIQRDVTEQRRTERALRLAQVREQRRRVSHQMLQVLMHEIRNPLTGILGNLQLLETETVLPQIQHCHDEIKQCAHGIEAALKQLSKLDLENPAPITGA